MTFKKNKIRAFTMVDILTGMVITSIIIGMVFYLFTALNKQVYHYGNVRNNLTTYLLLKQDLKLQFELAETIQEIPNGLSLKRNNDELNYIREEEKLLRFSNGTVDTLSTSITEMKIDSRINEEKELVHKLAIKLMIEKQEMDCYFFKDYSKKGSINEALVNVN